MRDARALSIDALETLRWRAVAMVRGGETQVATATALGVHKNTVSLWLKWWREGGDAALKPKRRGRHIGRKQVRVIEMLRRPEGATVEQIAEATGWQHHTIHCAISRELKKKLKLTIEATRTRDLGPNKTGAKGSSTVYRIIEAG